MQEKLALVEGARMAVVGTDPPELASEARRRAPTVVAGTGPGAQVRPDAAELDDGGHPRITWRQHALTLRSEEHTSELQSRPHLVCRLLLYKKNTDAAIILCQRGLG